MGGVRYRDSTIINRLPHLWEIDDVMTFCAKYQHLYIYGRAEAQEWLLKYFDMCDVKIDGFVQSVLTCEDTFVYREMPVLQVDEAIKKKKVGLILGLPDYYLGDVVSHLREEGFNDYFIFTEHTRLGIIEQIAPRTKQEIAFEINVVDHCNLSCQMCDHFSQLSEPWYVDVSEFKNDMREMGRIYNHEIGGGITLLGGEPTIHPQLGELFKFSREEFPNTRISILTNGILLLNGDSNPNVELWENIKKYRININLTVYPIKLDYSKIEKIAKEYGVTIKMSSDIHAIEATKETKISDKHTMDLNGNAPKEYCVNCLYFNKFNVVKNGRYYMCPIQAHIDIFNKKFGTNLSYQKEDSLDIYSVKDWHELADFGSNYVPFCRYCDLKKWQHASQWKTSCKCIEEYV